MNNPKMEASGLIDCVPQTGPCPHNCDSCFYNLGFYRTLDEPLVPSLEDAEGRIVRVNSGHDSALQKDLVLSTTELYVDRFYNTSTTDLDFPAPVVMTANPAELTDSGFHKIDEPPKNLMFVRARVNAWNLDVVEGIIGYYAVERDVPVVLTFMRYYDIDSVQTPFKRSYIKKTHLLRAYYSTTKDREWECYLSFTEHPNVYYCGSYFNSLCKTCGTCLREYYATKERMRS